jgi:hypothetical protein
MAALNPTATLPSPAGTTTTSAPTKAAPSPPSSDRLLELLTSLVAYPFMFLYAQALAPAPASAIEGRSQLADFPEGRAVIHLKRWGWGGGRGGEGGGGAMQLVVGVVASVIAGGGRLWA